MTLCLRNMTSLSHFFNQFSLKSTRQNILVLLLMTLLLSGCISRYIANQMILAPNKSIIGEELDRQFSMYNKAHLAMLNIDGVKKGRTWLPEYKIYLSYIDIAPADYGFSYKTQAIRDLQGNSTQIQTTWRWYTEPCSRNKVAKPNKVLVLLHGWGRNNHSMLSYGMAFAQLGYRVILPDLRGHGESSGDWVSFGAQEAEDIATLLTRLNIQSFDLIGFSLGASTGLHLAAKDRRVKKVAAIAPMHSLAQTIPKFVKQSPTWLGNIITFFQSSALEQVDAIGGFNYEHSSNTVAPTALIDFPLLFIYGSVDNMSGYALNKQLAEIGNEAHELVKLDGLRHTHVLLHQSALIKPLKHWFNLSEEQESSRAISNCAVTEFVF